MGIFILSALLIISWVVIFIQNKKINSLKPQPQPNLNRRGVLRQTWTRTTTDVLNGGKKSSADYKVVIEVEELDRLSGGLSRIKILKISGGADEKQRADIADQTAEIIETKDIHFTDEIEINDKPFNL